MADFKVSGLSRKDLEGLGTSWKPWRLFQLRNFVWKSALWSATYQIRSRNLRWFLSQKYFSIFSKDHQILSMKSNRLWKNVSSQKFRELRVLESDGGCSLESAIHNRYRLAHLYPLSQKANQDTVILVHCPPKKLMISLSEHVIKYRCHSSKDQTDPWFGWTLRLTLLLQPHRVA